MSFRIRSSKFRHVFGKEAKRDMGYDGIRITRNAWDSPFCSVNSKFLAVVQEAQGGGSFIVVPIENTGRVDMNAPKVVGHKSTVLDIQFSPFDPTIIASASEDCTVKVWKIPDGGLEENLEEAMQTLVLHQRRVGIVDWHPTAEGILLSAGFDYLIVIWNVLTGEPIKEIDVHTDTIYCTAWNFDGSLLATTSKDKKLRVIDPRSGEVLSETKGHEGTKPSRVLWAGGNRLFTTGFSKMSERQLAIWDASAMDKYLKMEQIDTSSGVLFPYYDPDTEMVYLVGKGDGNIRYYELTAEKPYCHFLSEFKTADPQRGVCFQSKFALNIGECEIARLFKLHPKGHITVVSFFVPRKSTMFQEDIFPPTKKPVPQLTAAEWIGGANKAPELVSLKDGYEPPARAAFEVEKKAEAAKAADEVKAPTTLPEAVKAWHAQRREIKDLKKQLTTAQIALRKFQS